MKYLGSFLGLVLPLTAWQVAAHNEFVNSLFFPGPLSIADRIYELMSSDTRFVGDLKASAYRLALGGVAAVPLAFGLAFLLEFNRFFNSVFKPLVAVTYPIPKLAVLPLLLIVFGAGDTSKIVMIAAGVFYLVLLSTTRGIQRLGSSDYFEIVRIYRIPFLKKFFRVLIPGVLPDLFQGCKLGLGYGLVLVVAGEFSISDDGIGFFMWNAWDQFRIIDVYCGLAVLSGLGLTIFISFDFLRKSLRGAANADFAE